MKRKLVLTITAILVVVILFTLFLNQTPDSEPKNKSFFVGVEYAYGYNNQTAQVQLSQLQTLVDKVKDSTNLFVIGSLGITFNQTTLTQACDYIYNESSLYFIVLFTGLDRYQGPLVPPDLNYSILTWMEQAHRQYGERFLGIYRYDEPGGNQLDQGAQLLVNKTQVNMNATYANVGTQFVNTLSIFPANYLRYSPQIFTADYGLYWFDYSAGYSSVFAEFVGNESRDRIIALCRGAADAFNKDWGVIINWKYNQTPYLENATELLADLHTAYDAGAKYTIVFSYPQISSDGYYGILNQSHFDALTAFWNYMQSSPQNSTASLRQAAYVLPDYYGYGFRSANDTIWGVFPSDNLAWKVFCDIDTLIQKYGTHFDILYDQAPLTPQLLESYTDVYYWNQTVS